MLGCFNRASQLFLWKYCKIVHYSKSFVYLPLIVRGDVRTVEGNLCLFPVANLE
jgi:hypothetical protein